MPSQGTAEERDVSKNPQISTNLYMIIQIWAFNVNPHLLQWYIRAVLSVLVYAVRENLCKTNQLHPDHLHTKHV